VDTDAADRHGDTSQRALSQLESLLAAELAPVASLFRAPTRRVRAGAFFLLLFQFISHWQCGVSPISIT
jgi:hypothetical protein